MRGIGWLNGYVDNEDVRGTRLKPARREEPRTLSIEAPLLTRQGYFASDRRARMDVPGSFSERELANDRDEIFGSQFDDT